MVKVIDEDSEGLLLLNDPSLGDLNPSKSYQNLLGPIEGIPDQIDHTNT